MPFIEPELQALKDNLLDMLSLVKGQLDKCREAIEAKSTSIAEEVIDDEKRVNAQELAIDRDCENILALYTPVATDLRLVLATLKITNDLERIGDNAKTLARFIINNPKNAHIKWLRNFNIDKMCEVLADMLKDMREALKQGDTKMATRTAKRDELINDFNKRAYKTTADLMRENPDDAKEILALFSVTRDLERAGDLTKNIAEELVFHIEAKVIKHQKRKE
jgi:phosphate transport system protein